MPPKVLVCNGSEGSAHEHRCGTCRAWKSVTEFYKDSGNTASCCLTNSCKKCKDTRNHQTVRKPLGPLKNRQLMLKSRYHRTYDETVWLYWDQGKVCALCLLPVLFEKLVVDHDNSHHPENRHRACRECIRGMLRNDCNYRFLVCVEQFPHLQTKLVKNYLKRRPFATCI